MFLQELNEGTSLYLCVIWSCLVREFVRENAVFGSYHLSVLDADNFLQGIRKGPSQNCRRIQPRVSNIRAPSIGNTKRERDYTNATFVPELRNVSKTVRGRIPYAQSQYRCR